MPLGTVLKSFGVPGLGNPTGLAYDGRLLWLTTFSPNRLFAIDPRNGSVIQELASPALVPLGLTWDDRLQWMTDNNNNEILQVDPFDPPVVMHRINSPGSTPDGLTWDDVALWTVDTGTMYRVEPRNGTILRSFSVPAFSRGLAWDRRTLWHSDTFIITLIRQVNVRDGTFIRSFTSPDDTPRGLALDGRSLWLVGASNNMIYQLSLN